MKRILVFLVLMFLSVDTSSGNGAEKMMSPNGGEQWCAGSQHYITWKPSPNVRNVRLECTTDGGGSWQTITSSVENAAGRFLWRIPNALSTRCKVRICNVEGSNVVGESHAPFAITSSQQRSYRWELVTDKADYAPRDGAGALVFHGRMWLLGGWNPGDKVHFPQICNSEVWSSTDGAAWKLETQAPWEGRHTAGYVVHDDKMWIVGGDANQRHYQNDVWNTQDGVHWAKVSDGVPWGDRVLHYTIAYKDKIWVMGGQPLPQFAPAPDRFHNDVWNTSDGVHWTQAISHAPWPPRGMIGGSAVFADRMWILGGGTYDTPSHPQRKFYNDVWSSADGVEWRQHVEFAPWEARQYHDVAVFDNRMWVLEGWNRTNRKDVWYSSDGVNWYELPDTPWAVRHAASVFVFRDALWMVAGNNMGRDVWRLTRVAEGVRTED